MWDLAVREQDYASAQAMLQRYRGAPPWSNRALLAFVRGDSLSRASLLEEAKGSENRQVQIAARFVATYLGDLASAEELARLELAWRRQPAIRQGAQLILGWLEVGRGRWSAARPAFLAAEGEGAAAGRVHRALAATLPFLVLPRSDLLAVRAEIEAWTPERDADERTATATALRPHLRLYLLGLLSSPPRRGAIRTSSSAFRCSPAALRSSGDWFRASEPTWPGRRAIPRRHSPPWVT